MRVFVEFKMTTPVDVVGSEKSENHLKAETERVAKILAGEMDLESIDSNYLDPLVNEMATTLPADDADGFVTHVRGGMTLKSPRASLTIGGLDKDRTTKLRIRILAANNAGLPSLGKLIADTSLLHLSDYELSRILLWEKRQLEPLLSEYPNVYAPITLRIAIRKSPHMAIPMVIAMIGLIGGGIWASFDSDTKILKDTLWVWYGRLFGPFLMAVVTTVSAIFFQIQSRRLVRTAEWEIGSVHSSASAGAAKNGAVGP